jgi:hypothetical protein
VIAVVWSRNDAASVDRWWGAVERGDTETCKFKKSFRGKWIQYGGMKERWGVKMTLRFLPTGALCRQVKQKLDILVWEVEAGHY